MPQLTFEEIYSRVPADQVARLQEFRRTHSYKHLNVGAAEWQYISCGQGNQTLLLLPGALSVGESVFPLIACLEDDYRIIAPSYTLSLSMTELCAGIARILEAEGVDEAHVFGGSYGGLVAQYFVRQHPAKVRSLILSHTFVLTSKYAKPLWIAGKLFPAFPQRLLVPLLKARLNRILLSTLRAANHPETQFWTAYLNEAIVSNQLREVFIHQSKSLLDLMGQPAFTSDDLSGWKGKILIIESIDDPAIAARDRAFLKSVYPQAEVHTYTDAGHASSILKRDEVVKLIKTWTRRS
ncbi:MAG TPA: alpha/beta hydrolase [Pyrinomonadaceae bacterium]|nr:alpha/beta hydrolase [Pyrinomonadaceae bacterium]